VLQRAAVPGEARTVTKAVDCKVAKPKEGGGLGDAQRGAAPYLDAMWRMVAALLLGAGLGVLADRKLGWEPWGVVSGLGLGLGLGFWSLMRSLSKLEQRR
jgi:F0F1-type ATP synthase assembly protein I